MESSGKKTIVVLTGPTGVGKTELCLNLAETFSAPVINADSRQIFAELPIGTAAPTPEQQRRVRHFFVGTHRLADYYSASLYEQDVLRLLSPGGELGSEPLVFLSGGSMMYIDAVCNGIDDIPTVDAATRAQMKERLAAEGLPALVEELKHLDPLYYEQVDKQNPRRVVHALEICLISGKPYSTFRTHTRKERPFRVVKIGINRPREELYNRINRRVLQMMEQGLLEEARRVYPLRGFNSLNTVGYKELFAHFDGLISLDEAIRQIQSNTRRYARKQLTWFHKDGEIKWFQPSNFQQITDYLHSVL